ncbi:hypothetical protein RclHR1_00240028 [Rhizophagus clarus]|uniref:Uncharacterized protein n=1 Tax=Rhizophagus clarus TaxID=94130 RepID=A0A2Z6QXA3_9GLOM|nr:hypothetical protein RclHR1_00240028 [Rhizophagus clarus]GES86070.1 hypothetical protein GLOIN_2v107859 [Rhizophagus clarus]
MTSKVNLVQTNQEQSSNNNNAIDSESSELKTMATLLQNSIQGVQNSFSSIYNTLAANLQQSLEMTHNINSLMEQFLLSNLRITSNITQIHKLETQRNFIPSLLTITITNSGRYFIPNISCSLTFVKKDHNELANIDVECKETVICKSKNSDSESIPISSVFVPETSAATSTFTLFPQSQIIEKLRLAPSEFCHYNAKVIMRFASPGTGELLQKEHSFGLYLIDQCEKSLRFESQLTDIAEDDYNHIIVELSPYLLRQLWNVHPSSGLSETMAFEISWKNVIYSLIHIKKWIGVDKSKVLCQVFYVNNTESNYFEIVERIVEELKVLSTNKV